MRVAIVSDTHLPRGARRLPERCADVCRGADAIVHAGDFTTPEVVRAFRSFGPPLHAVHGNVDTAEVRAALPERATIVLGGVTLGMVHIPGAAGGRLERLRAAFPGAAAVVFGHTHQPEHAERGGFQVFNPGSPTERRRAPGHTMGLATIRDGRVSFELIAL